MGASQPVAAPLPNACSQRSTRCTEYINRVGGWRVQFLGPLAASPRAPLALRSLLELHLHPLKP